MDIVVRASIIFVLLYGLLRILGKRELAEMTPFEFVGMVVLGDLVQQGVTHTDTSLTGSLLAVGTFLFWMFVLSFTKWRFPRLGRILESEPTLIVHNGRIIEANLARDRISPDEVLEDMRQEGIAKIEDVALAVLEPNGKISFIPRGGK